MLRFFLIAVSIVWATAAFAHSDSKFTQGPHGGHIVDAGGGNQHWELVAADGELTLYVTDENEMPVDTAGGKAEAQIFVSGKTVKVPFEPAGENTMKAKGKFAAKKGMKVIVKTIDVGGHSFQARLTPLR